MKTSRYADKTSSETSVEHLIKELEVRVERGEVILTAGLAVGMFSSLLAPMLPPAILLPALSVSFAVTTILANINYHRMQDRLTSMIVMLDWEQRQKIQPLIGVFKECPVNNLVEGFNPLKNLKRTWKCLLGGLIMNPLWIPIFYTLAMHISEEKNLLAFSQAVTKLEEKSN